MNSDLEDVFWWDIEVGEKVDGVVVQYKRSVPVPANAFTSIPALRAKGSVKRKAMSVVFTSMQRVVAKLVAPEGITRLQSNSRVEKDFENIWFDIHLVLKNKKYFVYKNDLYFNQLRLNSNFLLSSN